MNTEAKEKNFFTDKLNIFIIAIIANALWGSAFPAIKKGYEYFRITDGTVPQRFVFAGIRFMLAGMLVILINSIAEKRLVIPKKQDIKGIVLLALIQTFLEYVFFYISLVHITGVKGSVINSAGNFFAVLLAHFAFKNDRMNVKKAIGCFLGFLGVVICNLGAGIDTGFTFFGDGFMLIAAFCFATGGVITKIAAKNTDSTTLTGYQLTLGGILLTAVGLGMGGRIEFYGLSCWLILAYLAFLSAAAFSLWAKLLKYNPVGKISLYGFLNPIFGVILSGLILNENFLDIKLILALICVSLGIYIVNKNK